MKNGILKPVLAALSIITLFCFLVLVRQVWATNLIVNGDFESGNVGFYSDLPYVPSGTQSPHNPPGETRPDNERLWWGGYDLLANPRSAHPYSASFGDHTTGSGLMMMLNGYGFEEIQWSQIVEVTPNTDYNFSAFARSWTGVSPAQLQFLINGYALGNLQLPSSTGYWVEFSTTWNSGFSTSAEITIINLNDEISGNDYVLDDISLSVLKQYVAIDVKPGSDPNCFNINGHGVVPVAILGSEDLDVNNILVGLETPTFNGLAVRVKGNKGPLCSSEDSNGDGFLDLVCHFEDDSTQWIQGTDDSAMLEGELLDGTLIEGTDSICIVP